MVIWYKISFKNATIFKPRFKVVFIRSYFHFFDTAVHSLSNNMNEFPKIIIPNFQPHGLFNKSEDSSLILFNPKDINKLVLNPVLHDRCTIPTGATFGRDYFYCGTKQSNLV
jgi:hypothetical protein